MLGKLALPSVGSFFDDTVDALRARSWAVVQTQEHGLVVLTTSADEREDEARWIVEDRVDCNRVLGKNAAGVGRLRILVLQGDADVAKMAIEGVPNDIIAHFRKGFPADWRTVYPRPPPPPPPPPAGPRRSSRLKSEDEVRTYDEDELLLRQLRQAEAETRNIFEDLKCARVSEKENDGDSEDDDWEQEELQALREATLILDMTRSNFWEMASCQFVRTRNASECQERWLKDIVAPNDGKGDGGKAKSGEDEEARQHTEEAAMKYAEKTAKLGTIRFRRQVRTNWEKGLVKTHRGGAVLATPFLKRVLGDPLPASCCKGIHTPVATFSFNDGQENADNRAAQKRMKMDHDGYPTAADSPDILVPVNRDNLDGYVVGIMRAAHYVPKNRASGRNGLAKGKQNRKSTPTKAEGAVSGKMTPGGSIRLKVAKEEGCAESWEDIAQLDGDDEEEDDEW